MATNRKERRKIKRKMRCSEERKREKGKTEIRGARKIKLKKNLEKRITKGRN